MVNPKIRSCAERKIAALQYMSVYNINKARPLFDYITEAYKEYFLITDIRDYFNVKYKDIEKKFTPELIKKLKNNQKVSTSQVDNLSRYKKYKEMYVLFREISSIFSGQLEDENYKAVCKNIKEHLLMKTFKNPGDSQQNLKNMAIGLLKELKEQAIEAGKTVKEATEDTQEAYSDLLNSETVNNLLNDDELDEIIDLDVSEAIAEETEDVSKQQDVDVSKIIKEVNKDDTKKESRTSYYDQILNERKNKNNLN